jgi:GAF domain-containing protein
VSDKTNRLQLSETQSYALIGALFGFSFPVIGTILEVLFSYKPVTLSNILDAQISDPLLWVVDTAPIVIGLFTGYAGHKQELLTKANEQLRAHESVLKTDQANLENYANERAQELEVVTQRNKQRAAQFEALARIARTISSIQILSDLLPQITRAISEQFGFYHVGIFLLDESKQYAILAAANSEGGRKLLERNHRLPVGGAGIVGFVANTGQPRIALDVGQDSIYFNNPDLSGTHSEIALPVRVGNEIFGVLDVQSRETNAFSQEDLSILSILADQVGVAIKNARTYEQLQEALVQAEFSSTQMSGKQWQQFLSQEAVDGFYFDGIETKKITPSVSKQAHSLSVPLTLRGTHIGTLKLSTADKNRTWTDDEIDMVRATAERTTIALENARLLRESQKKVAKERTIGEISAKIGSLSNLESLLQTAIQELGNTLPNTDIAIQISTEKPGQK